MKMYLVVMDLWGCMDGVINDSIWDNEEKATAQVKKLFVKNPQYHSIFVDPFEVNYVDEEQPLSWEG